ncbi:MarR family transcriptional regulator [Agathobaculum sp. TL06]
MEHQAITILRYISLLQRNTRRYFDLMLEQDQIGSGQQFFLLRIFENDGISMQDLARLGSFDKGTVTRAVQKLVIEGYVRTEADPQDKRVRHIYLTERARPLIDHVYQIRDYWTEALTRGLREEEKQRLLGALRDMAERSSATLEALSGGETDPAFPLS